MPDRILLKLAGDGGRSHDIDSAPVVRDGCVEFIDTDGVQWTYVLANLIGWCVIKIAEDGTSQHVEPVAGASGSVVPSSAPERAAGDRVPHTEAAGAPTPPAPTPAAPRRGKYDWAEVHGVILATVAAGGSVRAALVARYEVTTGTAAWLIKECRAKGFEIPAAKTGRPRKTSPAMVELAEALDEVERTDPAVARAAARLDRVLGVPVARPSSRRLKAEPAAPTPQVKAAPTCDAWQLVPPPKPPVEHVPSLIDIDPSVLDDPQPPASVGLDHERIAAAYLTAEEQLRPITAIAERFGVPRSWAMQWIRECRDLGLLPPRDQPQRERTAPTSRAVPRSLAQRATGN